MQPTFMNLKSKELDGFRKTWDPNALGLLAHTHTHTHIYINSGKCEFFEQNQ
jgi:hypothetical protein